MWKIILRILDVDEGKMMVAKGVQGMRCKTLEKRGGGVCGVWEGCVKCTTMLNE